MCIHPEEQAFLLIRTLAGHTHILLLGEMDTCYILYTYVHTLSHNADRVYWCIPERADRQPHATNTREKKKEVSRCVCVYVDGGFNACCNYSVNKTALDFYFL